MKSVTLSSPLTCLIDVIRNSPDETVKVLKAAREFRHLGLEVLPYVPVAERNDFAAIVTLNQKIVRLTGQGLAAADWRSP